MKNIRQSVKLILVSALILITCIFSGCVQAPDVIHSNAVYHADYSSERLEMISDSRTPLAAPQVIAVDEAEVISLVCEYVPE